MSQKIVSCKYCGEENLQWKEQANGKFRLCDAYGTVHDCPAYPGKENVPRRADGHQKRAPNQPQYGQRRNGGTLLRDLNNWVQRWGNTIPEDAMIELDNLMDQAAQS